MNKYIFSLANIDNTNEIFELYKSLVDTPGCALNSEYPTIDDVAGHIKSNSLYILKENEKIIAAAVAGDSGEMESIVSMGNLCELALVGVLSSNQNMGVGSVLLQNVFDAVKEIGFDGIRLLVSRTNPPALALYEKNGFVRGQEISMYGIDFYYYQMIF